MINTLMSKLGKKISSIVNAVLLSIEIIPAAIILSLRNAKQKRHYHLRIFASEVYYTGIQALPIVIIIGIAIGVFAIFIYPFDKISFGINNIYGEVFISLLFREVSPLMTLLVVAVRSGIATTIELTDMNINGEIDTLKIIGINPIFYLAPFRIGAAVLTVPILAIYLAVSTIFGGITTVSLMNQTNPYVFIIEIANTLRLSDILIVLLKTILGSVAIFMIAINSGIYSVKKRYMIVKKTVFSVTYSIISIILINLAITVVSHGF